MNAYKSYLVFLLSVIVVMLIGMSWYGYKAYSEFRRYLVEIVDQTSETKGFLLSVSNKLKPIVDTLVDEHID